MWSEISVIEIHIILAFESLDMMLRAILINLGTIRAHFVYFAFFEYFGSIITHFGKIEMSSYR